MLDSAFKVFCQQQPFTPPGFSICERLPFYNPDGCCHNNGEYIFYESESSSNKKTHVGAFLEACQAAKALNASALRLFFVQKENPPKITVPQLQHYFIPYAAFMRELMPSLDIKIYFITDINFEALNGTSDSIFHILDRFLSV